MPKLAKQRVVLNLGDQAAILCQVAGDAVRAHVSIEKIRPLNSRPAPPAATRADAAVHSASIRASSAACNGGIGRVIWISTSGRIG